MIPFLKEPTMPPMLSEWTLPLFKAVLVFCNYSAAAVEAMVVLSCCNEVLLSVALAFTNILACSLSVMLRLNIIFRLMLTAVLTSQEKLPRGTDFSSPSSQVSRLDGCSPLCCGAGRSWWRWKPTLCVVPALCLCSLSVWKTGLAIIHVAVSALLTLCSSSWPSVYTVLTLCGCIAPLLSTLPTATGYSKICSELFGMSLMSSL